MCILLPDYVKKCISTLNNAGYEAFCVGGAVRDIIANGNTPNDFDIAVSCPPSEVIRLFEHTVPTGIKHGTVTVIIDGTPLEVTTYRTDGDYTDSRHPDSVTFVGNISDDLARRDFTVNAIAYNEQKGIFDPFDGCEDIKKKVLRTVGDANRRFEEDALRILRLFRFASQLGFSVEEKTETAALSHLSLLSDISAERIQSELCKTLVGEHISLAAPLFKSGGLKPFEINPCDIAPLSSLPRDLTVRLSALIILSSSDPDKVCRALKTDNALKTAVLTVTGLFAMPRPKTKADVKRMLFFGKAENVRRFASLLSYFDSECSAFITDMLAEAEKNAEPYTLSSLCINGDDVSALGYRGREIGTALQKALDKVIEEPEANDRETLIKLLLR